MYPLPSSIRATYPAHLNLSVLSVLYTYIGTGTKNVRPIEYETEERLIEIDAKNVYIKVTHFDRRYYASKRENKSLKQIPCEI